MSASAQASFGSKRKFSQMRFKPRGTYKSRKTTATISTVKGVASVASKNATRIAKLETLSRAQNKTLKHKRFGAATATLDNANTGPLLVLFESKTGDGEDEFQGLEGFLSKTEVRMRLNLPVRTTNFNHNRFRVIMGYIKYDARGISATTLVNNLFGTSVPTSYSLYNTKGRTNEEGLGVKYIIKYDKIHNLGEGLYYTGSAQSTFAHSKLVVINANFFKNIQMSLVQSSDTVVGEPEYNCPFLLFITDVGGTDLANVDYLWRQFWTDQKTV